MIRPSLSSTFLSFGRKSVPEEYNRLRSASKLSHITVQVCAWHYLDWVHSEMYQDTQRHRTGVEKTGELWPPLWKSGDPNYQILSFHTAFLGVNVVSLKK